MRYGIVAFSLIGLAIASTGCSSDAVDVDFSADADRAIRFEGRCDDATRAVPGDPADGKVPVYWCDGDAVSVACAQATPSVGRYVLTCPDEFSVSASFGSGDSQQWGGGLHDFYAFSPADAPDLEISGDGTVKASLPSVQECRDGLLDPALLYLASAEEGISPGSSVVTLHFRPVVTLLDISFAASEATEVRQIVVRSTQAGEKLAGTFVYDLGADRLGRVDGGSNVVAVRMLQSDGTPGVKLAAGESCRAIAVVLSQSSFVGLRVDVVTAAGVAGRSCAEPLVGGKRYAIELGALPAMNDAARRKLYASWMSYLPDDALLSALSIPGTHDAATSTLNLWSKCQSLSLGAQLNAGVRCFDLRPTGTDDLMIYHGTSTGVTFDEAIAAMDRYLAACPSEGCIVQMQRQGDAGNDATFRSRMGDYLNSSSAYRDRFVDFRPDLTLGELRGKILVLTRSDYDGALVGGKIASWQDDVTDQISSIVNGSASAKLFIQDKYGGTTGIDNKKNAIIAYLDKARGKAESEWLFNFTSLATAVVTTPKTNARTLNPATCDYLKAHPGCTGVVMMDFAGDTDVSGDELLRAVIDQNFYCHLPCVR